MTYFILQFVPFILTPTTFPRREFEKAIKLQTVLNELIHRVAHDTEFLTKTLSNAIIADAFTKRLFEIYQQTLVDGVVQVRKHFSKTTFDCNYDK